MPTFENPPAHHGRFGLFYMSTSKAGAMQQVGLISAYTLDMARDKVETTALGDSNKTYTVGLKDLQGSISAFWTAIDDSLFAAAESEDGCQIGIYPSSQDTSVFFTGPAWLDVSIKGGVSEAVAIDGKFVANGAWSTPGMAGALAVRGGARRQDVNAER